MRNLMGDFGIGSDLEQSSSSDEENIKTKPANRMPDKVMNADWAKQQAVLRLLRGQYNRAAQRLPNERQL